MKYQVGEIVKVNSIRIGGYERQVNSLGIILERPRVQVSYEYDRYLIMIAGYEKKPYYIAENRIQKFE